MTKATIDKTYGVRFKFDSGNAGPGRWLTEQTFGPTSEARARVFFDEAVNNPRMRTLQLIHGDEVIA